ncbi:unnamed protein product, partial [marine sediment metagenome]
MDRMSLFKELTEAFGVSGYEDDVVNILKRHFASHVTTTRDKIGSI